MDRIDAMVQGQAVGDVPRSTPRSFGQAIREFRLDQGVSQEELGYRSGMDRSYVGGVERGERNPSLRCIQRLSDGLKIPASAILRRSEELAEQEEDR